jgi:hypothetical protein
MACFGLWKKGKRRRNDGKDAAQKQDGGGAKAQADSGKPNANNANGVHSNGANRAPWTDAKQAPKANQQQGQAGNRKSTMTNLSLIEEENSLGQDSLQTSVLGNVTARTRAEEDAAHTAIPIVNSVSVLAQHDALNQVCIVQQSIRLCAYSTTA